MKNVTGFDVCRLLVGSLGTLALLGEVVLRCRPRPEAEAWWAAEDVDPFAVVAALFQPLAVLWDGRVTWVGLGGYRVDLEDQARSVLRSPFRRVDGPPVPPGDQRRSLPPAGVLRRLGQRADLHGRWLAEIGVGVVHCDQHSVSCIEVAGPAGDCRAAPEPSRPVSIPAGPPQPRSLGAGGAAIVSGHGALPIDGDDLAACVSCGLCLAHCPTFRVTGEESLSPRGRIAAMRAVDAGAPIDRAFTHMMQTCVQCRACETACPSAVPFGRLMEGTRRVLASETVPWWQRAAYRTLGHHRLLTALTTVGAVAQRAHLVPAGVSRRLAVPPLPWRQERLVATGSDVWLFTGCIMDVWQRPVHRAAVAVLGAMGVGVALPGPRAACCGALHVHAGLHDEASGLARRVISAFPGAAPILVDSAGCGAALKDYGHLVGTAEAHRFADRVFDVSEWMAGHADRLPPPAGQGTRMRIAVQDPCHLRHVQRAEAHVRAVLRPYGDLVELSDEGRCCGAGGAYSFLQPELAGAIREQKIAVIDAARPDVVASANPGCALWLASAKSRSATR